MKTRYEKILKQPARYSGGIPQYSLGGILASTAVGAGTGAIGGGGVLSAPGAIIGGVVGLGTGLIEHFRERKEEKAEARANELLAQQSASVALNPMGAINNYITPWTAGKGGIVNGGKPVKIRNKELLIGPDNTTVTSEQLGVNTPQHTNKGIVPLQDGTVIVSPENTKKAKLIAKRQEPEVTKLNKILNNPQSTSLARKSAERRLAALKEEYKPLLIADAQKRIAEGGTLTGGNIPEAGLGQLVGTFAKTHAKDLINAGTQLAPVLYNLGQGMRKAENLNPAAFQNPMAYNALDSMRNRQPIIEPALQASDAAAAAADRNLRSTATGRGQYMSGATALANASMTNKANIYAQGSQMRNQYLGEYGAMQANLGQKMADTNLIVSDLNARNQAAKRNYNAAAAGQLSQWSQVQQQMSNQAARDQQLMGLYRDWMGMFNNTNTKANKVGLGAIKPPTVTSPTSGLMPYKGTVPTSTYSAASLVPSWGVTSPEFDWQMQGRQLQGIGMN